MVEKTQHNIRILVAEHIDLIRMGLHMLFANHPLISLIEATSNIADLFDLTAKHRPDVILMDLELVNDRCAEHVAQLKNICLHSRILLLSHHHSNHSDFYTLPPHVSGILSTHSPCRSFVTTICAIGVDQHCPEMNSPLILQPSQPPQHIIEPAPLPHEITASLHAELNNNERRVAHLAGKGLSAREISRQLLLTEKTVRNYLSAVYKKMGIKKQVELCLKAPLHNYFQD